MSWNVTWFLFKLIQIKHCDLASKFNKFQQINWRLCSYADTVQHPVEVSSNSTFCSVRVYPHIHYYCVPRHLDIMSVILWGLHTALPGDWSLNAESGLLLSVWGISSPVNIVIIWPDGLLRCYTSGQLHCWRPDNPDDIQQHPVRGCHTHLPSFHFWSSQARLW